MELEIDIRKTLRSGPRSFQLDLQLHSSSRRIVVFGPSGAGKSLLLKAIAGLARPDDGMIRLDGNTYFDSRAGIDLAPQTRKVGYLFQDYALFPHLTVRQNIGFGLRRGWFNPRPHQQFEAVERWLDAFGLRQMAHQLPHELSGGQRQRTALARALAFEPRALLLDEPFAALDPALRVRMRAELDQLQRSLKLPMILITHDRQDIDTFGEHVLYLRDGRIDSQAGIGCDNTEKA